MLNRLVDPAPDYKSIFKVKIDTFVVSAVYKQPEDRALRQHGEQAPEGFRSQALVAHAHVEFMNKIRVLSLIFNSNESNGLPACSLNQPIGVVWVVHLLKEYVLVEVFIQHIFDLFG